MNLHESKLLSELKHITHRFDSPVSALPSGAGTCHQVHSDIVTLLDESNIEETKHIKADGIFTQSSMPVAIQTADCLPVLFAARRTNAIAAVHAGWRGLHQGILPRTIDAFVKAGIRPSELVIAIGPAIGPCCFEVNKDVAEQFDRNWGHLWRHMDRQPKFRPWKDKQIPSVKPGRSQAKVGDNDYWLDLDQIARLQLVSTGVPDAQIEDVGLCTYCGPGEFASFRRATHEGATQKKRQWSWISTRSNVD
jgi:YfiH family protein